MSRLTFLILIGSSITTENVAELSEQNDHGAILLQTDYRGRIKKLTLKSTASYTPTAFEADYLRDDDNPLEDFMSTLCCEAMMASCLACQQNVTIEVFCKTHNSTTVGCTDDGGVDNSVTSTQVTNTGGDGQVGGAKADGSANSNAKGATHGMNGANGSANSNTNGATDGMNGADGSANSNIDGATVDMNGAGGVTNGTANGTVNGTVNGTAVNCTTREEPRASAFGYTTSPPGTPCIFGVDDRDEGSHCIEDDGEYGSFGWCFTSSDRTSFGSCSDTCPLFGQAKVLAKKIDNLHQSVNEAVMKLEATTTMTSTTTTTMTNTTTTTTATMAAPENGPGTAQGKAGTGPAGGNTNNGNGPAGGNAGKAENSNAPAEGNSNNGNGPAGGNAGNAKNNNAPAGGKAM